MSEKNNGGAAFPYRTSDASGMTLRDYFAAKAMQAIYMRLGGSPADTDRDSMVQTAAWAYAQADAMLRARGEA